MSEEEEQRLLREGESYRFPAASGSSVPPLQSKSFEKKLRRMILQKERKQRQKEASADVSAPDRHSSIIPVSRERIMERYLLSRKQSQVRFSFVSLSSHRRSRKTNKRSFSSTLRSTPRSLLLFAIFFSLESSQKAPNSPDIRASSSIACCSTLRAQRWVCGRD